MAPQHCPMGTAVMCIVYCTGLKPFLDVVAAWRAFEKKSLQLIVYSTLGGLSTAVFVHVGGGRRKIECPLYRFPGQARAICSLMDILQLVIRISIISTGLDFCPTCANNLFCFEKVKTKKYFNIFFSTS